MKSREVNVLFLIWKTARHKAKFLWVGDGIGECPYPLDFIFLSLCFGKSAISMNKRRNLLYGQILECCGLLSILKSINLALTITSKVQGNLLYGSFLRVVYFFLQELCSAMCNVQSFQWTQGKQM